MVHSPLALEVREADGVNSLIDFPRNIYERIVPPDVKGMLLPRADEVIRPVVRQRLRNKEGTDMLTLDMLTCYKLSRRNHRRCFPLPSHSSRPCRPCELWHLPCTGGGLDGPSHSSLSISTPSFPPKRRNASIWRESGNCRGTSPARSDITSQKLRGWRRRDQNQISVCGGGRMSDPWPAWHRQREASDFDIRCPPWFLSGLCFRNKEALAELGHRRRGWSPRDAGKLWPV